MSAPYIEFEFKTKAEAKAFVDGVAYVNDSAIEVQAPKKCKGRGTWVVVVSDWDGDEVNDEVP